MDPLTLAGLAALAGGVWYVRAKNAPAPDTGSAPSTGSPQESDYGTPQPDGMPTTGEPVRSGPDIGNLGLGPTNVGNHPDKSGQVYTITNDGLGPSLTNDTTGGNLSGSVTAPLTHDIPGAGGKPGASTNDAARPVTGSSGTPLGGKPMSLTNAVYGWSKVTRREDSKAMREWGALAGEVW